MNTEEMIKQMAQGGITVQGDLVMEKRVQYEVSNVEAGGIGIQVVNGEVKPQAASGEKKPLGGKEEESEDATDVNSRQDFIQEDLAPAPRIKPLFIEGDASWDNQGRPRNIWRENVEVLQRERARFLKYLNQHHMGNLPLTAQHDKLNSVVASFLVVWREKGWISQDFPGIAVHRFLHDVCGIKTDIAPQTYANKIKSWVNNKKYSIEVLAEVEDYFSM